MQFKTIVISLYIGILIIVITGIVFLSSGDQNPTTTVNSYNVTDNDKPIAKTENTFVDVGNINLSDIKIQDYPLTNSGTRPLQLTNITTNCGCTSGKIIYKDQTSKEFSMHAQSEYVTEIAPGDTAIVRLTYRPATMPVSGIVTREVYVTTNDPQNQRLVFSIRARVN